MATKSKNGLILLTGSNGLIGSRLQHALASDYQIVGLDKTETKEPVKNTHSIQCDLTKDESVNDALKEVQDRFGTHIVSVVHLAAYYDFSGKPSPLYRTLTVEGTRRLLHGLQSFNVEQFIFSSSLLVMKPVEAGEQISEEDSTRAEWDYPRSKLETEQLLREERGRIPVVILRLAGVYDEQCHSLPIGQQIRRIYEKRFESYFFPGDKTHGQAFLHLDDLATCIRRVITLRGELEPEELFLVAEPEVMNYEDLQERLGKLIHGKAWPAVRIPKPIAKAGAWLEEKVPGMNPFIKPWMIDLADDHYPVEIRRAHEKLEWKPQHRLSDTLEPMVECLKQSPRDWYELNGFSPPKELKLAVAK